MCGTIPVYPDRPSSRKKRSEDIHSFLNVVIVHELAGSRIDGSKKEEDDIEDDEGLKLGDGHSRLDVELRQGTLAGDDLADDGESNAELRQTPHKQLVSLGEPEHGALLVQTEGALHSLPGLDGDAVEASNGRFVHEPSTVTERTDCSQEGEEDEEDEQGLCLRQWDAGLDVELRQSSLSGQSLSEDRSLKITSQRKHVRCHLIHNPQQQLIPIQIKHSRIIARYMKEMKLTANPSIATRPTKSSFAFVNPIPPDVPKMPSSTLGAAYKERITQLASQS